MRWNSLSCSDLMKVVKHLSNISLLLRPVWGELMMDQAWIHYPASTGTQWWGIFVSDQYFSLPSLQRHIFCWSVQCKSARLSSDGDVLCWGWGASIGVWITSGLCTRSELSNMAHTLTSSWIRAGWDKYISLLWTIASAKCGKDLYIKGKVLKPSCSVCLGSPIDQGSDRKNYKTAKERKNEHGKHRGNNYTNCVSAPSCTEFVFESCSASTFKRAWRGENLAHYSSNRLCGVLREREDWIWYAVRSNDGRMQRIRFGLSAATWMVRYWHRT